MAATSTTGSGRGSSNKPTIKDLASLSNGPTILVAGYMEISEVPASPPSTSSTYTLPVPLAGGSDSYVVVLTTISGGYAYVTDMIEDDDGNFTGFTALAESECDAMFLVVKAGHKATV